jgi:hypothetical protein
MLLHDMKLTAVEIKFPFPFQLNDKHGFKYVVLDFHLLNLLRCKGKIFNWIGHQKQAEVTSSELYRSVIIAAR